MIGWVVGGHFRGGEEVLGAGEDSLGGRFVITALAPGPSCFTVHGLLKFAPGNSLA